MVRPNRGGHAHKDVAAAPARLGSVGFTIGSRRNAGVIRMRRIFPNL